ASDEIARQLKLRDLGGLIVIDFIDMEEKRNNRAVERRLKDALRHDRARIQLGRISHFGLMEMSRQRLRTGVLEGSTSQCQHCQGTGIIRSTESVALAVLRGLEDAITAGSDTSLIATTTTAVALYILNSKRSYVADMEARHGYSVTVLGSDRVHGANFTVERGLPTAIAQRRPERAAVNMDWGFEGEDEAEAPGFEGGAIEDVATEAEGGDEGGGRERQQARDNGDGDASKPGSRRKRRRRGGRRGERGDEAPRTGAGSAGGEASDDLDDVATGGIEDITDVGDRDDADQGETVAGAADSEENNERRRRRRRGRRGGRRGRGERDGGEPRAEGQALSNDSSGDGSSSGMETSDDFADDGDAEPRVTAPGLEPQPDVGMELAPQASPGGRQRHRGERGGERGDERGARGDRPEREPRRRPDRIWDVPKDTAGEAGDGEPAQAAEQPLTASRPDSRPEARTHSRPDTRPQTEHPSTAEARSETETHKAQTGGNVETRHPAIPEAPADSGEREPAPRRHETGSSEPRLERVVVRPGQTGDGSVDGSVDSSSEASPAPQRKGWWQRKFGGE
ncbi:MAG: ribonuclease E/G, partial [Hyphomicrobium sp.]